MEQLSDATSRLPRDVRAAADRLAEGGYRLNLPENRVMLDRLKPAPEGRTVRIQPELFDGDWYRFAVISDTHLGSREERLDELHTACHMIADMGVRDIYHPGDLTAGLGIYKGQVRDVHRHTFQEQIDYATDHLPRVDGATWHVIGGNHDLEGEAGRAGVDPVQAVANVRDDVQYHGPYDAWFELPNGAWIHMLHPGGGASYALSYRAQKLIEGYEAGRKPAILLLGHFHRRGWFESRNVQAFLCGTFEGSTNLAKRYGLGAPAVGFHLIEACLADDGSLVRIRPEWFSFYAGRHVEGGAWAKAA